LIEASGFESRGNRDARHEWHSPDCTELLFTEELAGC
jgi:hypothetical protein